MYIGVTTNNNLAPTNADGRVVDAAFTITHMTACAAVSIFVAPPPQFQVQLYASTNGGITYAAVPGVAATINTALSNVVSIPVPAALIASGTSLVVGFKQTVGGSGFGGLQVSAAFSG